MLCGSVPVLCSSSSVRDIAYRTGDRTVTDWSVLRPFSNGQHSYRLPKSKLTLSMKVEYLSFVLAPGGVYSVPGDTGFTALGSDPVHPAPALPHLFQLVSFNAFRMDHVRTSSLMRMKSWRKPAFIQRLDIVDTEEDATDEHLDVFPVGVPEPVDILFEFTWQI